MSETITSSIIRPKGQFLRSANLERDFNDPKALDTFVLTGTLKDHLKQITEGLKPDSGKRAWRLTGDYGSGKSTFALLLAHWMAGNIKNLSSTIQKELPYRKGEKPYLFPLLVTAKRESIPEAIRRAVKNAIEHTPELKPKKPITALLKKQSIASDELFELLHSFSELIIKTKLGKGLFLIVDELGKLLEYTSMNPEEEDVYIWQLLAEDAMRSKDRPFIILGLLHQGFSAYAAKLGMDQKREWEKVAGRFGEIILHHPTSQLAQIIAGALNVDTKKIPEKIKQAAIENMKSAIQNGWYGSKDNQKPLLDLAPALFPLDSFVLPVLSRLLHRIAQNERSLFSFLFGGEPFSVINHISKEVTSYRLSDLYDFVNANLSREMDLAEPSTWPIVKTMVEAHINDKELLPIIKTVGLLNVTRGSDLLATQEIISCACTGEKHNKKILDNLKNLQSDVGRRAIFDRGAAGGLCLWSHTSVDLHFLYETAKTAISGNIDVEQFVRSHLDDTSDGYLVGRSHYITTGNLRYFAVKYLSLEDALKFQIDSIENDGVIIVPLFRNSNEAKRATSVATVVASQSNCIVVVPAFSLDKLKPAIEEVAIWEQVVNAGELNTDPYASEIASKQKHYALSEFHLRIKEVIGLDSNKLNKKIKVFYRGRKQNISSSRDFIQLVSTACENTYPQSVHILNEIINRQSLSSAGAAAKMRLIEGLLGRKHLAYFGMDPLKNPPEMSMYKSIFQKGHLHFESDNLWDIHIPENDPLQIGPVIYHIDSILNDAGDNHVAVDKVFSKLADPPFGVSKGIVSLIFAIYFALRENKIALYEDDRFIPDVTSAEFMRLNKKPEIFAIQNCRIEGVRTVAFSRIADLLKLPEAETEEILEIVRPLCVFAANLPEYVINTQKLTEKTIAVRDTLLNAQDPLNLLFKHLPEALKLTPIPVTEDSTMLDEFIKELKITLLELRECYMKLLYRLETSIAKNFNEDISDHNWRERVAIRAEKLHSLITEQQLKAFTFRVSDKELSKQEWIESVASLVQSKPPEQWNDNAEALFLTGLNDLAARFYRTEATLFTSKHLTTEKNAGNLFRLCLTKGTGQEQKQVFSVNEDDSEKVDNLKKQIEKMIKQYGDQTMTAIVKALWDENLGGK